MHTHIHKTQQATGEIITHTIIDLYQHKSMQLNEIHLRAFMFALSDLTHKVAS